MLVEQILNSPKKCKTIFSISYFTEIVRDFGVMISKDLELEQYIISGQCGK